MAELAAGLFGPVDFELARPAKEVPGPGALPGGSRYEPKWDGYLHSTRQVWSAVAGRFLSYLGLCRVCDERESMAVGPQGSRTLGHSRWRGLVRLLGSDGPTRRAGQLSRAVFRIGAIGRW